MIEWLFFDCRGEVGLSPSEISLEEHQDAKSQKHLRVLLVLLVGCHKGSFDLDEVKLAALRIGDLLVLWMVLEPLKHVIEGIFLSQLICKADTQSQKTV